MANRKVPSYCRHKPSNRAYVKLNGRQVYLDGPYGNEESCKSYTEVLRQWQEHDHHPLVSHDELAVTELLARYLEYARRYYRKDDKPTSEVATLRSVIHVLNEAYGDIPVVSFGPLKLEALRHRMIERGWCRNYINKQGGAHPPDLPVGGGEGAGFGDRAAIAGGRRAAATRPNRGPRDESSPACL